MPAKHRVNEGFMQCSDCHNPHGADALNSRMMARPRMLAHGLQNEEPCLKCHIDKRGPFVFEHAAVRVDGCGSCHAPHGSMNSRLLKRPQVFTLCLECHNGAGNFGRDGNGISLPTASHSMTDVKYQNCTACHVRIHGSNSHSRFLR
jgi:DmsE family decaheme c-type cytochrome